MNTKYISKSIALSLLVALAGCGSNPAQSSSTASKGAILSAADLQSMIQVTVTQLESEEEQGTAHQEAIVAAN